MLLRTPLVFALAVATALAIAGASSATDPAESDLERAVLDAVNRHREANGLPKLAWSEAAAEVARAHSRDMAAGRVGFGHDGFDERRRTLQEELGRSKVAENVWQQSSPGGSVVEAALGRWLASPPHRANIDGAYRLSGVGAGRGADWSLYLTQIFVETAAPAPESDRPPGSPR
jgi:uncharacterized protein YkwD